MNDNITRVMNANSASKRCHVSEKRWYWRLFHIVSLLHTHLAGVVLGVPHGRCLEPPSEVNSEAHSSLLSTHHFILTMPSVLNKCLRIDVFGMTTTNLLTP